VGLAAVITVLAGMDFLRRNKSLASTASWRGRGLMQEGTQLDLPFGSMRFSLVFLFVISVRRIPNSYLLDGIHGGGRWIRALLRLPQSFRVLDADPVMADNLMLLYLGGKCWPLQLLLIGFWYTGRQKMDTAARKPSS